mmetsp:Transcript_50939/g.159718  ORF Transcript_50939/g.159718 Transcript_50939/m.159718 type:complete len:418 (+) Transcript_50939:288-1541(+)
MASSSLSSATWNSSGAGGSWASHSAKRACSSRIRCDSFSRRARSAAISMRAWRSASSIAAMRRRSISRTRSCFSSRSAAACSMTSSKICRSWRFVSICLVTICNSWGTKLLSTASCTASAKMPASRRCARARSLRLLRCAAAMLRDTTFRIMLRSCSRCDACCWRRRCISSCRRFSAASILWTSSNSALRRLSKSSWCLLRDSSSSSSSTSIMLCSRVLPTRTSSTGSHSTSKSKSSPSSIWVSMSTPIFAGMKSGDGGRSRRKSVCVSASNSTVRSVSSSRYESVWMSICLRPGTGSGVPARLVVLLARISRLLCASRCFCTSAMSGWGATSEAYVFPRTTLRSCMILFAGGMSCGSRYFLRVPTACGAEANCCTAPCIGDWKWARSARAGRKHAGTGKRTPLAATASLGPEGWRP